MYCRPACQHVLRACPRGATVMFAIALALPVLVPALSNASRLPPPASLLPPLTSPPQQGGPVADNNAPEHVPGGETNRRVRPDAGASTSAALGDAARRAQRVNGGGRVLSIRPVTDGYHVKLIKHGEVRIVIVPHH